MSMIARALVLAVVVCAPRLGAADDQPPGAPPPVDAPARPASDEVTAPVPGAPRGCDDAVGVTSRLRTLLRARRFSDVHHAAVGLRVLCGPDVPVAWRVLDDIALLRLEDRPWALEDLEDLSRGPDALRANTVLAWAHVADHDRDAARVVLARLPAPRAAAVRALGVLDDPTAFAAAVRGLPMERRARALAASYLAARQTRPAVAGVLSAILPGSGQIYAGSPQAAVATFVLNGLLVGATIELAGAHHYATAAAAGMAASFFYVGGIMNAVDLARRRNRLAMQPYADELERLLVPELDGL